MFRSEKIFKANLILPRNKITNFINTIHAEKICQIKISSHDLEKITPQEDEQKILNLYSRLEFVNESLSHFSKRAPPNLFKELFSSKWPVTSTAKPIKKEKLYSKIEETLDIIEDNVKNTIKELKSCTEKRSKNKYLISNLNKLPDINTDLLKDSSHIKTISGIINNSSIENIKKSIEDKGVIILKELDKKTSLVIIISFHDSFDEISSTLHEIGLDEMRFPYENLKPSEIISKLKKENKTLLTKEKEHSDELHSIYITHHKVLDYFHSELKTLKEKIDALNLLGSSESFSILECWLPQKNLERFRIIVDDISIGHYLTLEECDDAPTLLNNPAVIKPFEALTELYSLPKYTDIDPTPILAITFSLFFGFMLTDFVYGFILFVFGILLIRGKGSYHEKTKNLGIIITSFGIFTLLLGMAFGSYFGDLFQQLGFKVPLLVDSLGQVMIVLIISLVIGVVHLLTGLGVGFFENLKKKKTLEGLQNQGVWILFVFSLIAFIIKQSLIGYILLGASILTQVILTAKQSGGISAILSIFSFPGFIGDLFSYGRLMALAIGTTGIALAVNFMTLMVWNVPYIGPVAAILVFTVGHIFNMAMNGLGAFVHSVRLHFLEFFSKFYEGSGKKYIPFGD